MKKSNCIEQDIVKNKSIKITILTTTYNRAHTIHRLYDSLLAQSDYSFKWLIVDDGSVDNTRKIIEKFDNTYFPIKYVYKENGGKHTAVNMGMQIIDTEYTFIVDSDDRLCENAIRLIKRWIKEIDGLDDFAGVAGTCISEDGRIIGEFKPKEEYVDCYNSSRIRKGLMGDKAEVYKSVLLKENTFPVFLGEKFIPESVVWNKFSLMDLNLRWHKEEIKICEYLEDGLTSQTKKCKFFEENINGYKEDCKINFKALPFPYNYSAASVYYARCIASGLTKNAFDKIELLYVNRIIVKFFGTIRYKLERY